MTSAELDRERACGDGVAEPILSVVIPTHGRPSLLARGIESVIAAHRNDLFEIVVVPNGPRTDWKPIQKLFAQDDRIHWHPIERASAAAARNHGLGLARGAFVRFLDDDDILLPASSRQLAAMRLERVALSSAPLEKISRTGRAGGLVSVPRSEDFVISATLSIDTVSLAEGTLYRREALRGITWREGAVLYDDYLWMLDIASNSEWTWIPFYEPVARYVDHAGFRLSYVRRSASASKAVVDALLQLRSQIHARTVNISARDEGIACALMTHAHSAFPLSPVRLTATLILARSIAPRSMPLHNVFKGQYFPTYVLVFLEWVSLPLRYISRVSRRLIFQRANLCVPVIDSALSCKPQQRKSS